MCIGGRGCSTIPCCHANAACAACAFEAHLIAALCEGFPMPTGILRTGTRLTLCTSAMLGASAKAPGNSCSASCSARSRAVLDDPVARSCSGSLRGGARGALVSFGETVPYVGGSAAFPVGVGDASFEPCMSACLKWAKRGAQWISRALALWGPRENGSRGQGVIWSRVGAHSVLIMSSRLSRLLLGFSV